MQPHAMAQAQPQTSPIEASPINPATVVPNAVTPPPAIAPALPTVPLKPGDRIAITVVGFPDLSGEHVVAADGTIQMPLVGYVQVSNASPAQVVENLTTLLQPYVRRPRVGLAVLNISPIRIVVVGEVVQPGPRLLSAPDIDESNTLTLSNALALAGGVTPKADLRNIKIRRAAYGTQQTPLEELNVDLWQAIQLGSLDMDVQIFHGDEILVPAASDSSTIDQRVLLASTVAPQQITIHVAGEVEQPGQIQITPSADLSAAVAAAGGFTPDADDDSIMLFRMAPNGQLEQQEFAFGESSTTLMHGDLVVVNPSRRGNVGILLDFVGRVLNPVGNAFRIFDVIRN
ncbi:MAG: SLBB domain-containing protein [Synechococcales bacterium]|nr:SLBB domain-containing protein [Synechococcales bacterium]